MYDFIQDPDRLKDKLFVQMSENYLTNTFPVEAVDWEQEQLEQWIEENKWEPFVYWDNHSILELIEMAAIKAYEFWQKEFKPNAT
tara:strand:+ start:211 stop:465 length:255 start_codon:yes stop_codon:yes gene_type:complete